MKKIQIRCGCYNPERYSVKSGGGIFNKIICSKCNIGLHMFFEGEGNRWVSFAYMLGETRGKFFDNLQITMNGRKYESE